MLKNSFVRYTLILGAICLVASVLLSVVYGLTQPRILYQKALEEQESLAEVFPSADSFEAVEENGEVVYYKALSQEKKVVGYAFKASRRGYSSDIVTMVGIDPAGVITHIKILSQNETPGLGTRVAEVIQKETLWDIVLKRVKIGKPPKPWFQEQFSGKQADGLDDSIQAITGATITSKAVIDSIREKTKEIMERIQRGG